MFLALQQPPSFHDYKKFKTDFIGTGAHYGLNLENKVSYTTMRNKVEKRILQVRI